MRAMEVNIRLMEREVFTLVMALSKAALYEFESWAYIKNKRPEEVDECVMHLTSSIRQYEATYTQIIRKLCREQARHQSGTYRRGTECLRQDQVKMIHRAADKAIAKLNRAAAAIKEGAGDTSRLTCDDRAKMPEDKSEAL